MACNYLLVIDHMLPREWSRLLLLHSMEVEMQWTHSVLFVGMPVSCTNCVEQRSETAAGNLC